MADEPSKFTVTQDVPSISWDPSECSFQVTLMGIQARNVDDPKQGYKLHMPMPVLYDIRVRRVGSENWLLGVILPFSGVEFSGLEPGAEYEIQTTVLSRDKKPLQDPVIQRGKAAQN